MSRTSWAAAIKKAPVPERAQQYYQALSQTSAGPMLESARPEARQALCALFSGSQYLSEWLQAHPECLADLLDVEALAQPRALAGLRQEVQGWLQPALEAQDYAGALRRLRQFKQRQMLRIAARDLARLAPATSIIKELSDVADVCLSAVGRVVYEQFTRRYGQPWHAVAENQWEITPWCVLGLGKLGGQELNYSSDVDVIFVYAAEGIVAKNPPRHVGPAATSLTNHQFFCRMAEAFVAEVGRVTTEGQLYRIDLRLRPEGKAGPLARSLESYENYYAQWGQTWERMMLIKARPVAGDAGLAHEFAETIQAFRYPRMLSERVIADVAAMKARTEAEVVRSGELERNVKLGRGGIREIEFIVQVTQLLHAGRNPFLQIPQTLPALQAMVKYGLLQAEEAQALTEAYCFLRNVEHRLQMENNRQTHTIPENPAAQKRLAALMGFPSWTAFARQWRAYQERVRAAYENRFQTPPPTPAGPWLPPRIAGHEEIWLSLLAECSFRDPPAALKWMAEFLHGPGYGHLSAQSETSARELAGRLLTWCPRKDAQGRITNLGPRTLSDPDRVLARLDAFIAAYGSRAMLYEAWTRQPSLFEMLVLLFDRSEYLAETAIRTPDLVDDLVASGQLRRSKTAEQTLADLRHGLQDADQAQWLRRYFATEFMRIGLREIIGLADPEQNLAELSALADACLQYAVEVVMRRHRLKKPPFAIIGLGKLGGAELTYGSDLDLLFVAARGSRHLHRLTPLAAEIMALLSEKTADGSVFHTDARLRPDGEKGLLVNALEAYEAYYRQRAQLWEIQALSRARAVAGDAAVGREFTALAQRLTNFAQPDLPLSAYQPGWRQDIVRMRWRIEKERTPPGKEALAIKTGAGGIMDVEFIAQTLALAHGLYAPNTLQALQALQASGALDPMAAATLTDNFRQLRRVEIILRRWSYEGESELPADPAPFYRVSVRCGFATPEDFRQAVARWRKAIREIYQQIFAAELAALNPTVPKAARHERQRD
ncbi:MAG: bifunctional [glutamate--ammonia ligase]-adenylyl-L-tyrosine phosphorylase/[glutamate--ammonia-ligase] adenylyltransferase [Verrucomicrobiae bacterium]|nr:bifunctional [glutamate--ammonia ligase]-adenylyl-L-tyrosine phosphorylase/[glutamate--ammonia-ligase] adenylyltransferase [Verrucomicrobiae bacterium]